MIEPAGKPTNEAIAPPTASKAPGLLVVLTIALMALTVAFGFLLFSVFRIEREVATLVSLSGCSILLAVFALASRARTVNALNYEIASLQVELQELRTAQMPGGKPSVADLRQAAAAQGGGRRGGNAGKPPELRRGMTAGTMAQEGTPGRGQPAAAPGAGQGRPRPAARPNAQADDGHKAAPPPTRGASPTPPADGRFTPPPMPGSPPSGDATGGQPAGAPGMTPYWAHRPGVSREPVVSAPPMRQAGNVPGSPSAQAEPLPKKGAAPRQPVEEAASQPRSTETPAASAPPTDRQQPSAPSRHSEPAGRVAAPQPPALGADWPKAQPLAVTTAPLDLGVMQNLIAQLAMQLNQPAEESADTAARNKDASDTGQDEGTTGGSAGAVTGRGAKPDAKPASAPSPGRAPHTAMPRTTPPALSPSQPPPSAQANAPYAHLALIADAVEAQRMDVYLDPILGLADRKARHFELSLRLRGDNGEDIGPSDYAKVAAGSGLLARIDSTKLAHAAEVAQRLRGRGSQADLFSNVAGESLADDNFLGVFADILTAEEGLGTKLVLTFSQADARHFSGAHWQSIAVMSEIGLRFALEDVTDLDMDFSLLRHHGFEFIKLDAPVFLEGLPTPNGLVPAADICRHLAGLGLGLIVGGIVEENDLAKILGFGALLGQGTLFGAPRSVELERERRAA